jgi:acetyl esterase/lipase
LALCTTSYNPKGMLYHELVRSNEYISPGMYTKNDTLLKFPRSRIIIGGLDPFKDDNYRLVHRLLQAGAKDVMAKEFRMLSHGFLGFH